MLGGDPERWRHRETVRPRLLKRLSQLRHLYPHSLFDHTRTILTAALFP